MVKKPLTFGWLWCQSFKVSRALKVVFCWGGCAGHAQPNHQQFRNAVKRLKIQTKSLAIWTSKMLTDKVCEKIDQTSSKAHKQLCISGKGRPKLPQIPMVKMGRSQVSPRLPPSSAQSTSTQAPMFVAQWQQPVWSTKPLKKKRTGHTWLMMLLKKTTVVSSFCQPIHLGIYTVQIDLSLVVSSPQNFKSGMPVACKTCLPDTLPVTIVT